MTYEAHDHTLSPGCWCAPIVVHVPPGVPGTRPIVVSNPRDADRLAQLGFTDVVVTPDVPTQGR